MTTLTITLPWAVVVPDNARAGVLAGRVLLSRRYRTAKDNANMIARLTCKRGGFASGPVRVTVDLHPPDRRTRDITNSLKLICDSLSGAAFADDAQIEELTVRRRTIDRTDPRAIVTVAAIADA